MAQDSDELGRTYGQRSEDPRVQLGAQGCGIFWVGGLLVLLLIALVISLGILWIAMSGGGVPVLERFD